MIDTTDCSSNPKDYADNQDARQYDVRLRPPIRQVELDIDPETGMKNYIANERGDWATSSAFIRYSLARSIHFGRMYTHGGERRGDERDLCEALRCLGQGLHTLEDFAAHTNYCELALREMGFQNVFPHTGYAAQLDIKGHYVFPLVTGTFGMVDFFHSVLGEATDHFTQSEVNEMDNALGDAQSQGSSGPLNSLTGMLGKIPGTGDLVNQAYQLQSQSEAQKIANQQSGAHMGYAYTGSSRGFDGSEESTRAPGPGQSGYGLPGMPDFDPQKTVAQIYPILEFRDRVVRKLTAVIEKIPGLEALVDKISETLTVFIMSLLAPFIRPIINAASDSLKTGSSGVINSSGEHQYEPWTDPICTDPTHSLLSKDHFSNILNEPAGHVASAILKYVAPRVLYAWEHIDVPEHEVLNDCLSVFHHPALRNMHHEAHRHMFEAVQSWVHAKPGRVNHLNHVLSAEGVREGKNVGGQPHSHGGGSGFPTLAGQHNHGLSQPSFSQQQHQQHQQPQTQPPVTSSLPWDQISKLPISGLSKYQDKLSSFLPGGFSREAERGDNYDRPQHQPQQYPQSQPPYTAPGSSGAYYSQPPPQSQYGYAPQPGYGYEQGWQQQEPNQYPQYPGPGPDPGYRQGYGQSGYGY